MNKLINELTKAGFTNGDAEGYQADANDPSTGEGALNENGDYVVHGLYTKGDVQVLIEQTTAPDDPAGNVIRRHDPVVVISSPKGRVACNPNDLEAILHEVDALS